MLSPATGLPATELAATADGRAVRAQLRAKRARAHAFMARENALADAVGGLDRLHATHLRR